MCVGPTFGNARKAAALIIFVYLFLVSIKTLGFSFQFFGEEFAQGLIAATSNPLVAVAIGLLATTLVQSSSTTTSIIVGLVAGGMLPIPSAIFMVMGANIGTTVTNLIVSIGHIMHRVEFKRAFAGSTVHDFFNLFAVMVLLPIEYFFHPIGITARFLAEIFVGAGGFTFISPLKILVSPAVEIIASTLQQNVVLIVIFALALMFASLYMIVRTMKSLVLEKIEKFLDAYLFKTAFNAFFLGLLFTAIVQSSSVTTSVIVPLLGAGVLTLRKVYPYALGANLGTTVTALLASLVTGSPAALTVAFAHLMFNIFGIAIFYPLRRIPIAVAEKMGEIAYHSRKKALAFIAVIFYIIPILIIILMR